MRIRVFNRGWLRLLMTGLGSFIVAGAHAFTPISGPIAAVPQVPANVVLVLDNSTSMVLNKIGNETRLDLARRTARQVMSEYRHLRFGLFSFRATEGSGDSTRDAPGGELLVPVDSIDADSLAGRQHWQRLNAAMDKLEPHTGDNRDAWTWAPLAETHYEVTRYLRGMRAFYPQSRGELEREQFESPIEYRCQRTAGLILGSGLPTYDREFPRGLAQDPDGRRPEQSAGFHLPDWDQDPLGDLDGSSPMAEGSSFFLDDIAAFAHDIDLRQNGRGASTDAAGKSWDDPAFMRQSMQTYIVGFNKEDQRLDAAARAGGGRYFSLDDAQELPSAMASALLEVSSSSGSGAGAVVAGSVLQAGSSRYYHTRYDPADWSGSLQASVLDQQGLPSRLLWSTDRTLPPGQTVGVLQSWRWGEGSQSGSPVSLDTSAFQRFNLDQQNQLHAAASALGLEGVDAGQRLLDWARGERVDGLRSRRHQLGDIINSAPVLLSQVPSIGVASDQYRQHLAKRQTMQELIMVGANDGFLRIFDAGGRQAYAYLPATLHPRIGDWARADYGRSQPHLSGVDGRISLADIELSGGWATLAASGLGAGGKGLFALEVLAPGRTVAQPRVLWEVNANQPGWDSLGYVYAEPQLVNAGGRALLLTGNGYGSERALAELLVIDATSGQLLRSIAVSDRAGVARENGLAGLTLQRDEQGRLTAAFAGDQHGQLWKFDLSDADYRHWSVAHGGSPLFTAADDQPISVAPLLHSSAAALGDLLLFGTGQFLQSQDLIDIQPQSFYAVLDAASPPSGGLTPGHLQQQRILTEQPAGVSDATVRLSSAASVDWSHQYGWYLSLPGRGEKVTRTARIKDSRVLFSSGFVLGDGSDPCVSQAGGWLMSLALDTGAMLSVAIMDSDGDGHVDGQDQQIAGVSLDIGLPGELSPLDLPVRAGSKAQTDCNPELYLVQGSDNTAAVQGQSHCLFQRILWRQLL